MAKPKTPSPDAILRYGTQVATVRANLGRKKWRKFVKLAHARGHTIAGELSDEPNALKERTNASLRAQAQKSVAAAYKPAQKALSTREAAIGILADKQKIDDATYNTWLSGETDKLHAQAAAADTALATQQQSIADSTKAAVTAARADSLKRVSGQAGTISDPTQSTALDTSAADTAQAQTVGAAQAQTAAQARVGADSSALAKASLLAQEGARAASNDASTWKALGDVASDRSTLNANAAAAKLDAFNQLQSQNVSIQQANRTNELTGESLGIKSKSVDATIADANRKFKLASAQYGLDKWKASHADAVAQAKVKLGYDHIKSTEGIAAANRALNKKLTAEKIAAAAKKDKAKGGVTKDERNLYKDVASAQGRIVRWQRLGMTPDQITAKLRGLGADDPTIQVAQDLVSNHGTISVGAAAIARQLGITHVGYFWQPTPKTPTNLGGSGHL